MGEKGGLKVRLEQDELDVKLTRRDLPKSTSQSSAKLKAQFEETVTLMRNMSKSFPKLVLPSTQPSVPVLTCPSLANQHPLLQTLLKLVWEIHVAKFECVVQTFQMAVKMKVDNTRKLRTLAKQLQRDNEALLAQMQMKLTAQVDEDIREKWGAQLADIQTALRVDTSNVNELLDTAFNQAIEATHLEQSTLEPETDAILSHLQSSFSKRSQTLWHTWTLHMERHKKVLQGRLQEVAQLDARLAVLHDSETDTKPDLQLHTTQVKTDENEIVHAWHAMILELSTIKLDMDVRNNVLNKMQANTQTSMNAARAERLAREFADMLAFEEASMQASRVKLTQRLEELAVSHDRMMRELSVACNSSLAPVDSILKSMQLVYDLTLETARESIYIRALQDLKEQQL